MVPTNLYFDFRDIFRAPRLALSGKKIWVIVTGNIVGFVFYCFPLMFSELEKDLGASQTQLSSALSLFFIFSRFEL